MTGYDGAPDVSRCGQRTPSIVTTPAHAFQVCDAWRGPSRAFAPPAVGRSGLSAPEPTVPLPDAAIMRVGLPAASYP